MGSVLGERLIGEHPMATQELVHLAIWISRAAFQFRNGIDGLDLDSQDKEQTERTEEANNVGSRHNFHQCEQVVSATADVNMARPLCQGVSPLHLARSESEPSASDTDVNGAMVIPPSNQTVPVNNNGSAPDGSPYHNHGSHDYDNYGSTHQALANDDSNPSRSFLHRAGSDHVVTINSSRGPAVRVHNVSSSNTGLLPLSRSAQGQPHHGTGVTSSACIFSAGGFGLEAVPAFFDQASNPQKPDYALYGMLLSFVAVPVSIVDLILNARKQSTSENNVLWNILPEVFGLALACVQFISSALQFSFLCRHAANPVKVSVVPFLFLFALFAFKCRNGRN